MTMVIQEMQRVVVESPFKGDRVRNKRYLEFCLRDCIYRGESPYASHKLLTDCLDDDDPEERRLGISAGFAWRSVAGHVFYIDLGWSTGMILAKDLYDKEGIPYEIRNLPKESGFWKAETESGRRYDIGPATRTFLLDAVNEKIEEFENGETDCLQRIERAKNRQMEPNQENLDRLTAIREKLAAFRQVVEELA